MSLHDRPANDVSNADAPAHDMPTRDMPIHDMAIHDDQGSQTLEFALVSPLIAMAIMALFWVGALGIGTLTAHGLAQSIARQVALNGPINPPNHYSVRIHPEHPTEGASFHVTVEHPIRLPLPGRPIWRIRQEAWGVRAPATTPKNP